MAKKIKIKLNRDAVRKVAQSAEMVTLVEHAANKIAAAAGPGFEVNTYVGKRARAGVVSATNEARRAEAVDRALTRAPGQVTL